MWIKPSLKWESKLFIGQAPVLRRETVISFNLFLHSETAKLCWVVDYKGWRTPNMGQMFETIYVILKLADAPQRKIQQS